MRTERRYWISGRTGDPRVPVYIECEESFYCEDPACEARHDYPAFKWDTRTTRALAEVYHEADAERILKAIQAAEGPTMAPPDPLWIFTFGYDHIHPVTGDGLARSYIVIPGDVETSRQAMIDTFGSGWSMQYDYALGMDVVNKHGLVEIPWGGK